LAALRVLPKHVQIDLLLVLRSFAFALCRRTLFCPSSIVSWTSVQRAKHPLTPRDFSVNEPVVWRGLANELRW
jgi:hypothetical protein